MESGVLMINTDCVVAKVKNLPRAQLRVRVDCHLWHQVWYQVEDKVEWKVLNQVYDKVFR